MITQVPVFLYGKIMDAPFSNSDLELAKMTEKSHNQEMFTSHKQSLCQFLASNHFPLQDMA